MKLLFFFWPMDRRGPFDDAPTPSPAVEGPPFGGGLDCYSSSPWAGRRIYRGVIPRFSVDMSGLHVKSGLSA